MMFDEEMRNVEELVRLVINTEERFVLRKLRIVFNVCQILQPMEFNKNFKDDVKKMSEFVQNLLMNNDFRKAIYRRTALMEREPITYFGDDIPKGDQYDYDLKLEQDVTNIEFAITRFIGDVMKNLQMTQEM